MLNSFMPFPTKQKALTLPDGLCSMRMVSKYLISENTTAKQLKKFLKQNRLIING